DAFAADLARVQGDLPTVTSPLVLAELASIMARGRVKIDAPIEAVVSASTIEDLTPEDALSAGALHGSMRASGHNKVALGDCLIYATARRVDSLLVTCDTDLAKQPGVVVLGPRRAKRNDK